jgi:hypothetical protein
MTARPAKGSLVAEKYRLVERVGSGGMSQVYRAEEVETGRIVALKLLDYDRQDDASLAARLFHEAQTVDRIRHPGIVRVLDAGTSAYGPYIAMEYLMGESAAQVLTERGKLDLQEALATVLPVLDALHAAHTVGVVHRDLKPGNVFYSRGGDDEIVVKLLDFGVSKSLSGASPAPQTSTGIVMGTPDYLSPEQARGEYLVDGRSDVFAAGVVLFELLTQKRPFHAPTAVATAYKISHAPHPSVAESGGPDSEVLEGILDRALAKQADERFTSARELADALRQLAGPPADLRRALRRVAGPGPQRLAVVRPSVRTASTVPPEPMRRSEVLTAMPNSAPAGARVRGAVLRAIDQYVQQAFGAAARERVLAEIEPMVASELVDNTVQAILTYDAAVVSAYFDAVTRKVCSGNDAWANAAGAAAASGELAQLMRGALKPDSIGPLLRRIARVLSRLFDFGTWDVDVTERGAVLRIGDLSVASSALRLWLVGALTGTIAASGSGSFAVSAHADTLFGPVLVVDVVPR